MTRKHLLLIPLLFLSAAALNALDSGVISSNPAALLGMTFQQSLSVLGPPSRFSTARGEEPWQDDVVFIYDNHLSLFWFEDRVWQVRFDEGFTGTAGGLGIGMTPGTVARILGVSPSAAEGGWEVYILREYRFPLRLQVFYRQNRAVEYYLYRGDF